MNDRVATAEYHRNIIGVSVPFDLKLLRADYHRLMKLWHPDRFFGDPSRSDTATEKSKQFNLAFEFLSELLEEMGGVYTISPPAHASRDTEPENKYNQSGNRPKRYYEGEPYTVGFPDLSITEVFLKSSHIISTGYNQTSRTLYIKFKGDSIYRYFDVPPSLFQDFLSDESPGRFAHRFIYHIFRYERCQ